MCTDMLDREISAADMVKFSTNWLILLMHCLVVTIFYCVDNHFVAILLLLTLVNNEFYYIICAMPSHVT